MSLQQGARQKLEHLIKEYDFTHAAEYVIEHTRQGVRLKKSKKEDYIIILVCQELAEILICRHLLSGLRQAVVRL